MFDKATQDDNSIKTELNIKQEKLPKLVMVDHIEPHNNHIVYEIDQFKRTINIAQFTSQKIVHWFEILNGSYKNHEILKKANCFYISSLNTKNLILKINKKFGIDISKYQYIADKGTVGSHLSVKVLESVKKL